MSIPASSRLASYSAPNAEFEIAYYPLRPLAMGEALVRVSMSTICRSDIHSYEGHRPSPCPALPGHEIVGAITALGEGLTHDMRGEPLKPGDRVTWSEYFIPGDDYYSDVLGMPQKSRGWKNTATWQPRLRRITTAALPNTATSCRSHGSCVFPMS